MKKNYISILLGALAIISHVRFSYGRNGNIDFEFEKVVCERTDKNYIDFEYCYVKPVKRSVKTFSAKAVVLKLPITNLQLRLQMVYNSLNSYKPFLYDVTVDMCKFMKQSYNPIAKYFYNFIVGFTNINHTCPFNHHLIVDNVTSVVVESRLMGLPFPKGRYGLFTYWNTNNGTRAIVKFYFSMN